MSYPPEYLAAFSYLQDAEEKLKNINRYFASPDFLQHLKYVFKKQKETITQGTIFYRARSIKLEEIDPAKKGLLFEGYDKNGSFVNLNCKWPQDGRMNAKGIPVLYMASDVKTAIKELHPYPQTFYSVAEIKTKEDMEIVNLSSHSALDDTDKEFELYLSLCLQNRLSTGSGEEDYVFTQYIASYCKSLGYDGIAYKSKYATDDDKKNKRGINYVIFNYDKCDAISSKLYQVNTTDIDVGLY